MNRLEPIARYWRGSLLQQGWRLWLTELRACVPAWLALHEPPEQRWHWPLSEPVASAPGNARHVLVLAADAVLLQTIHLPVAAARNLSAVVGYELDRYTPFEADRLYFVARQERRTPTQLQVTLVAILRERLDQILSDCAALGLQPHRVDVGDLIAEVFRRENINGHLGLGAANSLSLRQGRVEKSPTRVGVHLDQLGSIRGDMKVIAHERSERAELRLGDRRRPRERCKAVTWQLSGRFHRANDPRHRRHCFR